ncbi:hypothetical protein SAMN05892883_2164 [Jatrophihabitans sp. GAS493]|uniref:hypothetical protein n=1 Tax=Jatrophihabitans sp. GAS493 TaxID=1907575 RepID=UPI000BB76DB2|nr:hypothetical protein [Jatrophihabitans sp. GAS493]SOD72835.1 hypothetical protein SAMN05892883_2164 [Jatrophihabitans sp. GAS493]
MVVHAGTAATQGTSVPAAGAAFAELAPMLRRAVSLNAGVNVRLQGRGNQLRALIWLPFDILVGRTVSVGASNAGAAPEFDLTVGASELLDRLDAATDSVPGFSADEAISLLPNRDAQWRAAAPPREGWRRVESVPGAVVRSLVAAGARALADAADREGIPGGQPRAEVTEALLDSVVLTLEENPTTGQGATTALTAEVTLRMITAVTRMGFLPDDAQVAVDICGRWTRVTAPFGNSYRERSPLGISLLT